MAYHDITVCILNDLCMIYGAIQKTINYFPEIESVNKHFPVTQTKLTTRNFAQSNTKNLKYAMSLLVLQEPTYKLSCSVETKIELNSSVSINLNYNFLEH
jgi:hypothetical protein